MDTSIIISRYYFLINILEIFFPHSSYRWRNLNQWEVAAYGPKPYYEASHLPGSAPLARFNWTTGQPPDQTQFWPDHRFTGEPWIFWESSQPFFGVLDLLCKFCSMKFKFHARYPLHFVPTSSALLTRCLEAAQKLMTIIFPKMS